jgi:perosamine synthetase
MSFRVPVYKPDLAGREKEYVNECLDSSWISSKGAFVERFERDFASRIGVSHAISVCNGTVALHLAMLALGIGPGDEVIVPTLTYVASVNAISYVGAKPVFVDSDRVTWQMDAREIERCVTNNTRAILAVHLYGQSCDMTSLRAIAESRRLLLIEDCAEAFGTSWDLRHVGTVGDIGTFSFFGNKTLTTGEGGMVVTNDHTLAERARRFRGQGLAPYREYWHDIIGYNFRMTNIAAAIGVAQLERADEILMAKRRLAARYRTALAGLPLEFHDAPPGHDHSHWMVSALTERVDQRDDLRKHLAKREVETRPVFHPVHTMPMYSRNFRRFTVAEDLSLRGLNLPSYHGISESDFDLVAASVHEFFENSRK